MSLEVVILAAGQGKRMFSDLPKVLHKVAGKPMLQLVLETAQSLSPAAVHIVIGHKAPLVEEMINSLPETLRQNVNCVTQGEQLGTGHAVAQAMPKIVDSNMVLVLYGDTPLTPADMLKDFIGKSQAYDLNVLSAYAPNPFGYGRIVRDPNGQLECIVEEKDASEQTRQIHEVNTGIICARAKVLREWLPKLQNNNTQGEYYLTDLAGMLTEDGHAVGITMANDFDVLTGVNSKPQLAFVERLYQKQQADRLMKTCGVTLMDPNRIDIRGEVTCGKDCSIDVNCIFEGRVVLGDRVTIKAGCCISNCTIGDDSVISAYTVMKDSEIKARATIGPFARLRPGNVLEDDVHIGDFVEVKKSHIGKGTKAGHLSYLGDAELGENVNVGAGTITCNYDGANKHKTVVGNDVFIGSDTQLVAPVEVPDGVTIGAGTTYTRRIEAKKDALVITRAAEKVCGYQRPVKKAK